MSADKKKPSAGETTPKSSISKSMKKSTKSRVKTPKPDSSKSTTNGPTSTSSLGSTSTLALETQSTTSSSIDSPRERYHPRGYAAFGPKTIKIIWEQHDTTDTDLSPDVLPVLAEDVSYKMWELAKNIKTYSTHSGGYVTSDLVNEAIKDSDCPPVLGSMSTEWDRIDYDGSYYFNLDKIIELRTEYLKDVQITMPIEPTFRSAWPIQGGCRDLMQAFMQSIFLITLGGTDEDFDSIRQSVFCAPFVGGCYRVLLLKIIQTLAFKQTNHVKLRCWLLMQTLVQHPSCKDVYCREEYFHLAEIFVCQLMDTFEATPVDVKGEVFTEEDMIPMEAEETVAVPEAIVEVKIEDGNAVVEEKPVIAVEEEQKPPETVTVKEEFIVVEEEVPQPEPVYTLEDEEKENEGMDYQMENVGFSPYTAEIVEVEVVDVLCQTIGLIGAINEFFSTECMHSILRRLEKFFTNRQTYLQSDYELISRAIRGLFALGEYAFREFTPFMEKIEVIDADDISDSLRAEFARCAIFLRGHDDIFLYEWLYEMCGSKLLPFMTHYARYHQKLMKERHLKRRVGTFKIIPKVSPKRVSVIKKSPREPTAIEDVFPDREIITKPQVNIRFKFAGCRNIPVKGKRPATAAIETNGTKACDSFKDIIIARRKLFKPLTDEKKCVHLSNFHLLKI